MIAALFVASDGPYIVLPNGKTTGQVLLPQIEQSYKDKKMPPLLGFSST